MLTVHLDADTWSRGSYSKLLEFSAEGERLQCCIGVALTQLGVSDEHILDISKVDTLESCYVPSQLYFLVEDEGVRRSSDDAKVLYKINDEGDCADVDRVKTLNKVANEFCVHFKLKERLVSGRGRVQCALSA